VFEYLQIYEPRERVLVGLADTALTPLAWLRRQPPAADVRRVLLLRLERIGDLLMTLGALQDARRAWPDAEIDLVVGSWNAPIAGLVPGVRVIDTADVPWLARESGGDGWTQLIARARGWRARHYDLVVNFEPDIRSNFLAWLTGAPRRVGYSTGGGAAWLTDALAYDPTEHVSVNARRVVAHAADRSSAIAETIAPLRLNIPDDARRRAAEILAGLQHPIVGVHTSGGRPSKQWHLDRFAAVGRTLAQERRATIVLTGASSDRAIVDEVRLAMAPVTPTVILGLDLVTLAAVVASMDLLVTGDTGPMHVAAAVETPVVALFGPSHPARYGPQTTTRRIVRIDLPCAPCGQVRLPPERCRGHVPDCLDGISVATVVAAAGELLDETASRAMRPVSR
jgi:lipopolysaccharide heptosyltransferase II